MSENGKPKNTRPNPTTNSAASAAGKSQGKPVQYVEGYLDERDQQWLTDNADSQFEYILQLLADLPPGLKFGLGFEERSNRYKATLTNSIEGHADCGKVLSSRAANPVAATFALYYRHYVKFSAGWGQSVRNNSLYD